MRRLSLTIFIILGFLILLFSLFRLSNPKPTSAIAQLSSSDSSELFIQDDTSSPSAEVTSIQENGIPANYYLPYPGILPDHPFYWLKMIRDRLKLWITTDPLEKSQLMITYADKRIGAAQALASGNQYQLAASTAAKAEIYLLGVKENLSTLDSNQPEIRSTWEILYQSAHKHKQILDAIHQSAPDEIKSLVDKSIDQANQVISSSKSQLHLPDTINEEEQ